MSNQESITKEDIVIHFTETNDSLEKFVGLVTEAFKEAETKRNQLLLEKLELFAIENNMTLDQVKAIFSPKVEDKPKKAEWTGNGSAGVSKPKFYIRYEDEYNNEYYTYRILGGKQGPKLKCYLDKTGKQMTDLVVEESELPIGVKEKIKREPKNVVVMPIIRTK